MLVIRSIRRIPTFAVIVATKRISAIFYTLLSITARTVVKATATSAANTIGAQGGADPAAVAVVVVVVVVGAAAHIIIRSIAAAVVAAEIVCIVVTALESTKRGAV